MTAKKTNIGLIALVVILCLVMIIGARVVTSKLSAKSQNLVSLQLKQASLTSEQTQLQIAKQEVKKYAPLAATAKDIVPQDKNQAEAVREIVNFAGNSNITLGSITFPKSDLGVTTPGSAASSKVNLSQLTRVKGLSGVYQLPITVTSDQSDLIGFSQLIGFLQQLENNRRTAQVTNIVITPEANNPSLLSFSISINEYIKP